jgi:hypothetical protein
MPKPERPATPNLDLARQEAEALAQYEQEVAEYQRREREEAPARATARAEREARVKQSCAACAKAAAQALQAVTGLRHALDQYVRASGLSPYQLQGRIKNFLDKHLQGSRSFVDDDLLDDLERVIRAGGQ